MNNPYTPPQSDVRDVEPRRLLSERPREVVHATLLVWMSLLIGVPFVYWEFEKAPPDPAATVVAATILALMAVLMAVINVAVWRGRNWARITFFVVMALSVVTFVVDLRETLQSSVIAIVFSVVSTAMDVAVFYLLFTKPGSLWFRTVQ